jgi:mRNA interferase RelE/StbE
MTKLDGLKTVLDCLANLQPKHAGQIARKILTLGDNPSPSDSERLKGYADFRRVDVGEYRIIYRHDEKNDIVEIILVGKRNDDDVYKRLIPPAR